MSARGLCLPDAATLRALSGEAVSRTQGWQCHHLLPRALSRHRQLSAWLAALPGAAPALLVQRENILWLPATEAGALASGMAMHRGPHPAYTELVAARIERLRRTCSTPAEAQRRITRLQRALAAALSGAAPVALSLNRNDPMRLFADYDSLDQAINTLIPGQPG